MQISGVPESKVLQIKEYLLFSCAPWENFLVIELPINLGSFKEQNERMVLVLLKFILIIFFQIVQLFLNNNEGNMQQTCSSFWSIEVFEFRETLTSL